AVLDSEFSMYCLTETAVSLLTPETVKKVSGRDSFPTGFLTKAHVEGLSEGEISKALLKFYRYRYTSKVPKDLSFSFRWLNKSQTNELAIALIKELDEGYEYHPALLTHILQKYSSFPVEKLSWSHICSVLVGNPYLLPDSDKDLINKLALKN